MMIQQKFLKIPPDVILVVGLVVELVRGLELGPNRGTPALEPLVNRVFILPVDV